MFDHFFLADNKRLNFLSIKVVLVNGFSTIRHWICLVVREKMHLDNRGMKT